MHPFLLNTVSGHTGGNVEVYVYAWVPPYGHWNQGETFGSQNGLTFMYPMISSNTGVWGPSKASLAANIFPTSFSQQIVDNSWVGIGNDKWTLPYDMDWTVSPLNSPTAWVGFTYGNTGHIGYTSVTEKVSAYSWVPILHRVWDYGRHYRAISLDTGITNGEQIYDLPNSRWNPIRTPWIKRKMNFIRQELRNIMRVMGNSGFYMTQSSGDDEFYIYGDYRSIGSSVTGSTSFYNFYMYPFNSNTGFTWYASFTGICAAPDYLVSQGITSFRSYLLSHGFTTGANSSKNVDGLTIMGNLNVANNIGANGSGFQTLLGEYSSAVADWVASHWQDYVNDFKELNGLTSDNTVHSNYGYYRDDVGMCGYTSDRNLGQFTGLLKQLSSDISPYPNQTPTSSSVNVNKFAYYNYNTLNSGKPGGYVQREAVGGFDAIYVYGAITNYILDRNNDYVQLLDRSKLFGGNSYGYGNSYAVNFNYNWQFPQRMGQSTNTAPIWFVPTNYLNSGLAGQTFIAPSCFEIIGATASMKYDPTGAFGSRTAGFTRCAGNSAPMFISWFLNPVWGITSIGTGASYGPANVIPLAGRDTLYGLTVGEKSLTYLNTTRITNPGATWTIRYFDNCGFPLPGNTIPSGSIYNQYWTHWYPMAFMALLYDVNWGRHVALGNVYRALAQNLGQYPTVPGSNWNGIQKPIVTWIGDQKLYGGFDTKVNTNLNESGALEYQYYVPTGVTFGYFLDSSANPFTTGITGFVGEAGPLYYENIRHQYLNKTIRYDYWNPYSYSAVVSATGGQVPVRNRGIPQMVGGITCFGICGAIAMSLARKINNVVAECNDVGGGLVSQTVYLAPGNMAERSYLMSGAAKADGGFLWRITFANPVTYPNVVVRGSLSGVTTEYRVAGITDYINIPNNKFGIWWETDLLETPIVENPPVPEATRRNQLNLPEVPKFEYDATRMVASRNPIEPYFVNNNPQLFCVHDNSTCGYWNQTESWGSQHGLSYMWPMVAWATPGRTGPQRALMSGGTFPVANGPSFPSEPSYPGVGQEPLADINMNSSPWNTSTGYIGFTFGSPGFIPESLVTRVVNDYSWIPNRFRTLYPSRNWRAVDGIGLGNGFNGPENLITSILSSGTITSTRFGTPWIKRKLNFMRAELTAFYKKAASLGFTMAHWECDDEYFYVSNWDLRSVGGTGGVVPGLAGNTAFYNNFIAPSYNPTGPTWYANFNGLSATPDCLIAEGITSMRSFFLTRGYTTTVGNYRFVDGLTAIANLGISGNIAVGGSPFQFPQYEYLSTLKDWVACMWQDAFNDFALYNGLCADNSMSGNYGYYRQTAISYNYQQPSWSVPSNDPFIPALTQRASTDLVPFFSNPKGDIDLNVLDYYSFNDGIEPRLESMFYSGARYVGHVDNIHPYGSVPWFQASNDYSLIDRSLDVRGNTYRYSNSGKTFGKSFMGTYNGSQIWARRYGSSSTMYNTVDAKKWFPPGAFNTPTSGATGSLVVCVACAEEMGNCGFFKYDPTGVCGSSAANPTKISGNKAPWAWSWHLNPVWGINPTTFNGGATIGPANHLPVYGDQILNGLTQGAITHLRNRSNTGALQYYGSLDSCGNPLPGNTLPAGTIYTHYWTHWYPLAFIALLGDVRWGRHVAAANVSTAMQQRNNRLTAPRLPGSNWFGVQRPINTWTAHQRWGLNEAFSSPLTGSVDSPSKYIIQMGYSVPVGITFNYHAAANSSGFMKAVGATFMYGEAGPMYYENLRHQYLNKTGRFSYWNPNNYSNTNSVSNTPVYNVNGQFPRYFRAADVSNPTIAAGLTLYGVCGADVLQLARKVNTVVGECQNLGQGIVYETVELSSVNMDERSYLASGAQLVDGNYLWRISFAHPATQSPIIVRGAVTGITTAYNINGVTDYINIPNSKFGIWWTSQYNEMPIVENPPVSEAERLGVLNLPGLTAFVYNPLTMTEAEEYRPPINAFAWTWPSDAGTGPAVINNWLTEANRFSNVSPFAVINQSAINDDWKNGLR